MALTASGRPIGVLATRGMPASEADRSLLLTFANHAALALERVQLRDQALRSELLEEVDRLRHALMGAVSHDLRTPLATMKVASSTLLRPAAPLTEADTRELYHLIDLETDRLTRLVTSLLDMTRIDAGVLEVRRRPLSPRTLVRDAVANLGSTLGSRPVDVAIPDDVPDVDADQLLIGQVLANLLDNADRYSPPDSLITVAGEARGDQVALSVADRGPGVPAVRTRGGVRPLRALRHRGPGRPRAGHRQDFRRGPRRTDLGGGRPRGGARFVFSLARASSNGTGRG